VGFHNGSLPFVNLALQLATLLFQTIQQTPIFSHLTAKEVLKSSGKVSGTTSRQEFLNVWLPCHG
ncbi:hypothetical protein, partial [Salmonella enterica]|uniref:hypothetical protein n=1 Tax=Salmonella enterica TaxID=28901 RepID=UPI0020C2F9A5